MSRRERQYAKITYNVMFLDAQGYLTCTLPYHICIIGCRVQDSFLATPGAPGNIEIAPNITTHDLEIKLVRTIALLLDVIESYIKQNGDIGAFMAVEKLAEYDTRFFRFSRRKCRFER